MASKIIEYNRRYRILGIMQLMKTGVFFIVLTSIIKAVGQSPGLYFGINLFSMCRPGVQKIVHNSKFCLQKTASKMMEFIKRYRIVRIIQLMKNGCIFLCFDVNN